MRAKDFIIERIETDDIGAYQLEECRRMLNKQPTLFESTDEYANVKRFWDNFKQMPIIGDRYLPISISVIVPGKIMNIARTTTVGELVKIGTNALHFDFGAGKKPFPYNIEEKDYLQQTILCKTEDEQEQVRSWAFLSFVDWRITEKLL